MTCESLCWGESPRPANEHAACQIGARGRGADSMTGAAHRGGLVVILFRLDLLLLLRRLMRLLRWLWWWLAVALLSLGHAALESRRTLQIFGSPLDQSLPRARNGFLREAQA